MKRARDPIVYHGISNPKGEETDKTTFYTTSQLKALAPKMMGTPIKILHLHKDRDNNETPASGHILHAAVHPETGELHTFFFLNDSEAGKAAQVLTGEVAGLPEDKQMKELSLGYSVAFKNGDPKGNKLNELSICWEGDRKGTKILNKIPISQLITKSSTVKKSNNNNNTNTSAATPSSTQPSVKSSQPPLKVSTDIKHLHDILRKENKI